MTPDRLPPHDTNAEQAVLGSLLRDNGVIAEVHLLLEASDFYLDAHQKIFAAILGVHEPGARPVDLVLLHEELNRRGHLEDAGRGAYLAQLWDAAPTAANAVYYARIVRDKAVVRRLMHAATEVLRDAYDAAARPEELLAAAEQKILSVAQAGALGQTYTLDATLPVILARIDARQRCASGVSGLPTGFSSLDELTAGWQPSELIVLGARPSVGKTSLALEFLGRVWSQPHAVFLASIEQSRLELTERLLARQARVNGQDVRRGLLSNQQMDQLFQGSQALYGLPFHIDDAHAQTVSRIGALARRLHRKHALALVCVDYLQLVTPENPKEPRRDQVGMVARRLKALARELDVPVLALAQLNRESENRVDRKPRLSDLRESGEIEQHADLVMLLHRDDDRPDLLELLVRKNRNGPTGEVTLTFHRETFRFEDLAPTPFD